MLEESHKRIIRWKLDNENFEEGFSSGLLSEDAQTGRIYLNIENSNIDKGNNNINSRKYNYIYGESRRGFYSLIDCSCVSLNTNLLNSDILEEKFISDWVLFSKYKFDASEKINEVIIEFEDIKQWINKSPIEFKAQYKTDPKTKRDISKYVAIYNPRKVKDKLLYKSEDFNLFLRYLPEEGIDSLSDYSHHRKISYKVLIVCELNKSYSYNKLDSEIIFPIRGLFSILFGFSPKIRSLKLLIGGNYVDCLDRQISFDEEPDKKILSSQMVFSQGTLHHNTISMVINKWFNIFKTENNVRNGLYKFLSVMNSEGTSYIEEYFLALSLAFESFCRHNIKMNRHNKKRFKDKLNKIFEKNKRDDPIVDCMLKACQNANNKSQAEIIRENLQNKNILTTFLVPDVELFISYQKGSRNSTIHPKKDKYCLQGIDLYNHAGILYMLCYSYILNNLGLKEERIVKALMNSYYKTYLLIEARNLYDRLQKIK